MTWGQGLVVLLYPFVFPALFTTIGGDLGWAEAWIFGAVFALMLWPLSAWLIRNDPELFRERFSSPIQKEQAPQDRILLPVILVFIGGWLVLIPLDAKRFGGSENFQPWVQGLGVALLIVFAALMNAAFRANTYLSPVVKTQAERQHRVVTTGPYRWVRHPMYAGIACMLIGGPLLLGSVYGLLLGLFVSALFWVRSIYEERLLSAELEGYDAYRNAVRYRLIPFVL